MEVDSQKLRDDPTIHYWSLGSNNQPSSQSRKISIGILVDSLQKNASKDGDIANLNAERVKSGSDFRKSAKGKSKIEETTAPQKTKQTEAIEPVKSPWINTRNFFPKATTSETILCTERISNSPASKKFNGVTYERKGRRDGSTEGVPEFTFATVPNVSKSDKKVIEDKANANGKTESLRLKLQEILGAVSTPNEQSPNSPTRDLGVNCINQEQAFDEMGDAVDNHRQSPENREQTFDKIGDALSKPTQSRENREQTFDKTGDTPSKARQNRENREQTFNKIGDTLSKPGQSRGNREHTLNKIGDALSKRKQNSDTIETDSDSDYRIKRPVTRSSTRKRAPAKAQKKTKKSGQLPGCKLKHQEKNISPCEDKFPRRLSTVGGSSSMFTQKKSDKKSFRVEPRTLFHEKDIAEKIQEVSHRSETSPPAQKTSSFGKIRDNNSFEPEKERDYLGVKKNISNNSPLIDNRDNQYGDFVSPDSRDQHKDIGTPSMKRQENVGSPVVRNVVNLQDGFRSPTFGINAPISSSSLSSMPNSDKMGEIRSFRVLQSKTFDCSDDQLIEPSVSTEKLKGFPTRKASNKVKEKYEETPLSESSTEDTRSASSEEGSPINDKFDRCRERNSLLPETSTAKKMKFLFRSAEKLRSVETNVQLDDVITRSPSIKGRGESNWIPEQEHGQEDGLARALEMFALELQKLKSKIKSVTSKKSSEILMSVVEDIHLRLHNVESQIQTDMGKLKSVSTLKRKRMDTRFEEQQEKLQLICERFKEQINQYLEDCKSSFEELETDHLELKETMEKRKKSHLKLMLQVEEAIQTLLNEAERKITATHEFGREKMLQLKQIVALCLKEGILS
ncbi:meiosis-specific protein ASY3 [Humulus lupulus]|uniref:meiosis-specific protein ASY3 n=1 Tax=Humulus lupulus TaxID=3486 RepID=UPI002B404ADD|nr:meiosis-specific protein ASY3 [Humulus lupulus]